MAIFIFEDNIFQGRSLQQMISEICAQHRIPYDEIILTHRVDQIMKKITSEHHIYFVDIDIHGDQEKGFLLAKEIRQIDITGIIVFVTTHSSFAPISYSYLVSALHFINKNLPSDIFYREIEKCLLVYAQLIATAVVDDQLLIDTKVSTIKLRTQEVLYFEVVGPHKIQLTALNRNITFQSSLKDLENLKPTLIKCHQSFIVNTEHIIELDKSNKTLHMSNHAMIPVSKRQFHKIKKRIGPA